MGYRKMPFPVTEFPEFVSGLQGEVVLAVRNPSFVSCLGHYILVFLLGFAGIGMIAIGVAAMEGKNTAGLMALGLMAILFALAIWASAWIRIKTKVYVVTNKRIVAKSGWIAQKVNEVRISDIRGANLCLGIWERLVGTGTISVGTAATGDTEIVIWGVRNPKQLLALINSQR